MSNQLRHIREVLYALKTEFGVPIRIHNVVTIVNDVTTGRTVITESIIKVRRAVALPIELLVKLKFQGGYTGGGANPAGAPPMGIGVNSINMLIDAKDFPTGYVFGHDDYVVKDHVRYDVKSVNRLEENMGILISMLALEGARAYDVVHRPTATNALIFNQQAQKTAALSRDASNTLVLMQEATHD